MLVEVATSTATSVAASGAIVWLSRTWIAERLKRSIGHEYDLKLEQAKADLSHSNAMELERLKTELNAEAQARAIQFQGLYAKQAEALHRVHVALYRLYSAVDQYAADLKFAAQSHEEELQDVENAATEFQPIANENRVFMPSDLEATIRRFTKDLMGVVRRQRQADETRHRMAPEKRAEISDEIQRTLDHEFPDVFRKIEARFRELLGVESIEGSKQ